MNTTWEPVSAMKRDYPTYLDKYERYNELLNNPGWKQLCCYVNNTNKMNLLINADKAKRISNTVSINFVMNIPCNQMEVMRFDVKNGNTN